MNDPSFPQLYSRRISILTTPYNKDEFLYPSNEIWPEQSFDYPFAQAPTVSNLPAAETDDWEKYVYSYYLDNAARFGLQSAEYSAESFLKNGISGYGTLDDNDFLELICEGLYSKFLVTLEERDLQLFGIQRGELERYQYLKCDLSCMRVVRKTWPGEQIAPAIVVIRRPRPANKQPWAYDYELIAIALAKQDEGGGYLFCKELVFEAKQHVAPADWWLAKFFALQGAIHRINLVDHIRVHFPSDTINAITKSVLPQWHLLQQLLLPHFWLTLPVNNTVLEGERSLINRNTWYPWSPLVAKGEEIRRLIPLSWGGSSCCWDEPNAAYPAYAFGLEPESLPFIQLQVSRFAKFQRDYYDPILSFTTEVLSILPPPADNPVTDPLEWLEIRRWAYEINKLVPGFPDEKSIRSPGVLAKACAMIIWNAAVVHTADHCALHKMFETRPVPFIMRVPAPTSNAVPSIGEAAGETGRALLLALCDTVAGMASHAGVNLKGPLEALLAKFEELPIVEGCVPLCWPGDLIYAKMADLLFYLPHGSSQLYACDYPFLKPNARDLEWTQAKRPVLTQDQRDQLARMCANFKAALLVINSQYYDKSGKPVSMASPVARDSGKPPYVLNKYGFPKVVPGTDDDPTRTPIEACFSSGVQY